MKWSGIAYSIVPTGDVPPGTRVPRWTQRKAVQRLRSALAESVSSPAVSVAHSRNLVVAAAATSGTRIGIDIEWTDTRRQIQRRWDLAFPGLGGVAVDSTVFYRGWTFAEAWFKAFQVWPMARQVDEFLRISPQDGVAQFVGRACVFPLAVGGFQLCLVWQQNERGLKTPVYIDFGPSAFCALGD